MAPSEAWLLTGAQTRSSWSIVQNTSLFPRSLAFSLCSRRRPRVSAGKNCGGAKSRNDETTHDQRSALPAAVDRRVLLADSANPAILSSHRSGRGPSGILVVQFLGRQYQAGHPAALGSIHLWGSQLRRRNADCSLLSAPSAACPVSVQQPGSVFAPDRSEERRAGKECRS